MADREGPIAPEDNGGSTEAPYSTEQDLRPEFRYRPHREPGPAPKTGAEYAQGGTGWKGGAMERARTGSGVMSPLDVGAGYAAIAGGGDPDTYMALQMDQQQQAAQQAAAQKKKKRGA